MAENNTNGKYLTKHHKNNVKDSSTSGKKSQKLRRIVNGLPGEEGSVSARRGRAVEEKEGVMKPISCGSRDLS